jgi:hypothetical protein
MKDITNILSRGNLTARERFILLAQNDVEKGKNDKEILTEADKYALEYWKAHDNNEARVWNTLNDGWMATGRMDLEIELIYKDAQTNHLANLPFTLALLTYPTHQKMEGAIKTLKDIKKVTVEEAAKIVQRQREEKLKDGFDFEYATYLLAFELLSPEDKKRMKELYEEVEYEHQWLDQEEIIASLLGGKEELTPEAKKKLAALVAEKSYNSFAQEYQLFHYFACIPVLEIAKYALKSKGIEIPKSNDDDGLYESDLVKKALQDYASEHGTNIKEMLRKACLAALDSGLLDDHVPLVMCDEDGLFARWLKSKKEARKTLKNHNDAGELVIRKRTETETRTEKLYSKKLYGGELELARKVLENSGMEMDLKCETDERVAFETFDDLVITGESLYSFKGDYEFVKDFKERVDKYDPNLGLVYAEDDPEQKGNHLDQELLICDFDKKGEPHFFSRYGMSTTMIKNIFEALSYFKEVDEGGKTYLEFRLPLYEALYLERTRTIVETYSHLLAFEEIFEKIDQIYEAELSWHVRKRMEDVRKWMNGNNEAVRYATNTQKEQELEKKDRMFRRKDKLHTKQNWMIDIDSIKPDRSLVQKHLEKLRNIFPEFRNTSLEQK